MDEIDVYSRKILEITAKLRADRRLNDPDCSSKKTSRICGSSIEIDVNVQNGVVVDYGHSLNACALGQTSASVIEHNIIGASVDEVRLANAQMVAMLKDNGPIPTGRFADLSVLETVRDFSPRHKSILLVFDALMTCFDELDANSLNKTDAQ